jgi:hypothetical protein
MKPLFTICIMVSLAASLPESATAESSSKRRSPAKPMMMEVGGVETIKPLEAPSKDTGGVAGWSGTYVGVNAGMGFGATAGTNIVEPFRSSEKTGK